MLQTIFQIFSQIFANKTKEEKVRTQSVDQMAHLARQSSLEFNESLNNNDGFDQQWYIDSGASYHMCRSREQFDTYETLNKPISIRVANDSTIEAIGIGEIRMQTPTADVVLQNVEHVNGLAANLMSVRQATKQGHTVIFRGDCCIVKNDRGLVIMTAYVNDEDLYVANIDTNDGPQRSMIDKKRSIHANSAKTMSWHRRVSIAGKKRVIQMAKLITINT